MKIKGVIEDLKFFLNGSKNSKNIYRTFSGIVVGSVGSVHFWIVPWSSLYFPRSIGPFLCSRYERQGFNLLHLSLPRRFPLFSFFCLLVSSVSDFRSDTRGAVVDTCFFRLTCSVVLWGGRDAANKYHWVRSQCLSHTGPAPAHGAHRSGSRLLRPEPSEAGRELHAPPMCKLLRLRHSGSPQRCRLGWACILCPSQVRVARVFGERGRCDLSPLPSLLLSFLGV